MKTLAAIAILPLASLACAGAHRSHASIPVVASDAEATPTHAAQGVHGRTNTGAALAATDAVPPAHDMRLWSPGDFVVYRFSGTLKKPMTLTERVVAQEGDVTVIDFTLQEGTNKSAVSKTLRVRMGGSPLEPKVMSVALLEGTVEGQVPTEAFDDLLARTVVAADRNDGLLRTEDAAVDVDGQAVRCTRKTYRVSVGKRAATMTTLEALGQNMAQFSWGDLGGEIRADNGALLYKAEVVRAGNVAQADAASTAVSRR